MTQTGGAGSGPGGSGGTGPGRMLQRLLAAALRMIRRGFGVA